MWARINITCIPPVFSAQVVARETQLTPALYYDVKFLMCSVTQDVRLSFVIPIPCGYGRAFGLCADWNLRCGTEIPHHFTLRR